MNARCAALLLATALAGAPVAAFGQAPSGALATAAAPSNRLFPDSRLVTADRISVEVVGRGPDLVLIPGLASSRETWRATAERLRGRYRLHLVQVAGFAGEPPRANASGEVVAPTAEAIDAYIVAQKLGPATVIGHSLGGTMSLYLAEHHPEHLKKLLVVDALPFFGVIMAGPAATTETVRPIAEAMRKSAAAAGAGGSDAMVARMVSAPADKARVIGWGHASDGGVVMRAMTEDMMLDLRPGLAEVTTPITLLYPDNTPAGAPPGSVDKTYIDAFAPVPHKTLIRIDNSLHFIMYDQPKAFDAALDAFLAR